MPSPTAGSLNRRCLRIARSGTGAGSELDRRRCLLDWSAVGISRSLRLQGAGLPKLIRSSPLPQDVVSMVVSRICRLGECLPHLLIQSQFLTLAHHCTNSPCSHAHSSLMNFPLFQRNEKN